ncbi:uncharacterized protein LOC113280648 [Papaver somniferum]|uniref:uncharacterized protein LOC113280648 n=1 Tax=Papaver somniferum TaxID=3469 RepID=UPI000E7038C9|nr:uncharacterized protein LOC113280648 [Papaver somniferum]
MARKNQKLNCSFISLIPMKEDSCTPRDYMPLSMLGTAYKILSKGAFVKERQVVDGVLIANVFDNVKWKVMLRILEKHGFGSRWISWMNWCVSTANISILVNGSSIERFKTSKCFRQGDSLSPFLFLLVVEILSKLVDDAVLRGEIHGFQVAEDGLMTSHLQFADDTLVFIDANADEEYV